MSKSRFAFPFYIPSQGHNPGLTKRELFAAMALQGMLANNDGINRVWNAIRPQISNESVLTDEQSLQATKAMGEHLTKTAVDLADALLVELNKPEVDEEGKS